MNAPITLADSTLKRLIDRAKDGLTLNELSSMFGISKETVTRILRKHNVSCDRGELWYADISRNKRLRNIRKVKKDVN